jgi:D-glycero-D-manno-heptose 1,7-bisphosphate phosphatase
MVATGRKAVFLDRDGVLVIPEFREGRSFAPRSLDKFHFFPGADEALRRLKGAGLILVVVSNQPDVGHGLLAPEVLAEMDRRLMAQFPLQAVKNCIHRQQDECLCRKPKPGLLLDSAREFGLLVGQSFVVGDRATDIEAAQAAGCRSVFIDLGYSSERRPDGATYTVKSIGEAADVILAATT